MQEPQASKSCGDKMPATSSDIKATAEKLTQLKSGLAETLAGRGSAKDAMTKAETIRGTEAAAFEVGPRRGARWP